MAAGLIGDGAADGGAPVAVTARPGEPREADDLLVVSAPVDQLEAPLEQVAGAFPDAGIVVVTGDPTGETSSEATGAGVGGAGGMSSGSTMQQSAQQSTAMAQSASSGFTSTGSGFTSGSGFTTGSGFTSTGTGFGMPCTMTADCTNPGECCLLFIHQCAPVDPGLCEP